MPGGKNLPPKKCLAFFKISGLAHRFGADSDIRSAGLRELSDSGPFSTCHPLGMSTLKKEKIP